MGMFRDRRHAGVLLGERSARSPGRPGGARPPPGGVVVAAEVARALELPSTCSWCASWGPRQPRAGHRGHRRGWGCGAERGPDRPSPGEPGRAGRGDGTGAARAGTAHGCLPPRPDPLAAGGPVGRVVDDGLATGYTARAAVAAARARGRPRWCWRCRWPRRRPPPSSPPWWTGWCASKCRRCSSRWALPTPTSLRPGRRGGGAAGSGRPGRRGRGNRGARSRGGRRWYQPAGDAHRARRGCRGGGLRSRQRK